MHDTFSPRYDYFGTGWRLLLGTAVLFGLLFALRRMLGVHLVRLGLYGLGLTSFGHATLGLFSRKFVCFFFAFFVSPFLFAVVPPPSEIFTV